MELFDRQMEALTNFTSQPRNVNALIAMTGSTNYINTWEYKHAGPLKFQLSTLKWCVQTPKYTLQIIGTKSDQA